MYVILHLDKNSAFSGTQLQLKTAYVGDTVRLLCGSATSSDSNVDWHFKRSHGTRAQRIVSEGHLTRRHFEGRLNISGSTLIIKNVQRMDNGSYTCIEDGGYGRRHHVNLTVHGKFSE